jgi:transcriptional regulator with XRE-family HTH domain
MNLGQSIKTLRKNRAKEKQNAFAKNIGISQTYLSQVEAGLKTPSVELLQRIADYLKVPLPILFWFSVTEEDAKPEKVEYYRMTKPLIDQIIEEMF